MEALMYWGISIIVQIQAIFENCSGFMVFLSHVGDPRFAFTIYFPVAYVLHRSVGTRVLWVAVVSEWLNAVLKWLLHGERPYWWVHQPGLYPADAIPRLRQVNITCETGPGSPSGHAMITSAVWYILVSDFLYYKKVQSASLRFLCWALYLTLMCAVSVSRLFIATHFPHQVFAGILSGIVVARLFNTVSTTAIRPLHYVAVVAVLSAVAIATFLALQLAGVDPFWSVALATRWCAYREWVHLDTTLFYALVRDMSNLLGLGLGVWLSPTKPPEKQDKPRSMYLTVLQLMAVLAVSMTAENFKPSHDNALLFYAIGFVKHCLTVVFIVSGIPAVFNIVSQKA